MAVHCRVVCASANVCCARGVRIVGKRAAPAQNSLTYLAAQGCLEKVDYWFVIHKIWHDVCPDLQYLVIQLK